MKTRYEKCVLILRSLLMLLVCTIIAGGQTSPTTNGCEAWGRAGSVPKDFYSPVRSKVPTLLISGVLDPATPPAMAEQAAHDLSNSRIIAVKQGTHGTGSPCIDGLVAEFVKQGSAAGLDASCADQIHLPPFVAKPAEAAKNVAEGNTP